MSSPYLAANHPTNAVPVFVVVVLPMVLYKRTTIHRLHLILQSLVWTIWQWKSLFVFVLDSSAVL